MITTTVLAILAIALIVVLWAMFRPQPKQRKAPHPLAPPPPPLPAPDAELWNARRGDVVSLRGAADDFSDVDFTIDRRSAYESNNRRWIDLSGEFRGKRVYVEVHRSEPEVMAILDPRKLTLPDLGVTEEKLADIDARQDPNTLLDFEGKKWRYESSREIGYFENETGQGEGLYRWIFREEGGGRALCVEKWQGEPFDIRIARFLNIRDITVYRAA